MKNYKSELYEVMMDFRNLRLFKIFPGITAMEHHALKSISMCEQKNENVKISHVVAKMEIPAPGVSRMIRHMEEKGLVERRVDLKDRRNTFVSMTIWKHTLKMINGKRYHFFLSNQIFVPYDKFV